MTTAQLRMLLELYQRHAESMLQLAYYRLNDEKVARELVHDVFFLAACRPERLFRSDKGPKVWLYFALSRLSRQEERREAYLREYKTMDPIALYTGGGEDALHAYDMLPAGLTEGEREILMLRLRNRLPYEVIAYLCRTTPDACRVRYGQAVRRCEALLRRQGRRR